MNFGGINGASVNAIKHFQEAHEWKDRKACLWKTFDETSVSQKRMIFLGLRGIVNPQKSRD